MLKLKQQIKAELHSKDTKVYFITYCLTVLAVIIFEVVATIDFGGLLSLSSSTLDFEAIFAGMYMFFVFNWLLIVIPLSLIAYGIISYKKTKMIILPQVLLFFTFAVVYFVYVYVNHDISTKDYFGELLPPFILTMVSLVTSIITAIVQKISDNAKNRPTT